MTPPKRQLGIMVAAAIVIANMIGTGVFTSAGFQAGDLHDPWVMLSTWVVGGVLALCGASAYAELGSLMPHAGGEYVYLRKAYHPAVGVMSGWASLTAGFSAPIAAAALAFAAYLSAAFPALHGTISQKVVAIVLIIGISAMHAIDTKVGGWVQTGLTLAKVLLIVGFIIAGLTLGTGDWAHLARQGDGFGMLTTGPGAAAFATSLMYVSFAYSGWNAAAYIAGEIENPQRTLPRALLLGTGVVMAIYILLNLVFLYAAAPAKMAGVEEVGGLAAVELFGVSAGRVLSTVIALALVSSVSAMTMAGPRVYAAMAADHALPVQLARYSKRGVPAVAVITQCLLAVGFAIVGNLRSLIEIVGVTLAIFAALTVGAVFIFRMRGQRAPYRAFGYPVTPLLFVAISAWTVYQLVIQHPIGALVFGGLLVAVAVIYQLTSRGKIHVPIEEDEDDPPAPEIPEAIVKP